MRGLNTLRQSDLIRIKVVVSWEESMLSTYVYTHSGDLLLIVFGLHNQGFLT